MAKRTVPPRPEVEDGLKILGALIREARLEHRWTQRDLALRVNVSVPTIAKIEAGSPTSAVGSVFDAAHMVGVPIFGIEDRAELARMRRQNEEKLALLPQRVRPRTGKVSNDF